MSKKHTKRRSPSVMPIATYIHEASALLEAATHYREAFLSTGFKEETYTLFEQKILRLRTAQSNLNVKSNTRTDSEKEWAKALPKAFELRDTMLNKLKLAFWLHSSIEHPALKKMKTNNSIACLTEDLACLGMVWRQFLKELESVGEDATLGLEAQVFGDTLGRLHKCAELDRTNSTCRDARDSAYLDLKITVDSIRSRAHLLFKKGSREYQDFTSTFYRKRNAQAKKRAAAKVLTGSLVIAEEKIEETVERIDREFVESVLIELTPIIQPDDVSNQEREYPLRLFKYDRSIGAA